MPKVTTLNKLIAGNHYKIDLWYSTTNKFHIKGGLPEDMVTYVQPYSQLNDILTEQAITSELDRLIGIFNTATTVERKVILVKASLTSWLSVQLNLDSKHPLSEHHFTSSDETFGFKLAYEVLTERSVGGKTGYVHLDGSRVHKQIYSSDILLDYTEAREGFFKKLVEATKKIGANMADFFGSDPALLAEKIDNGQKLLG